MQLPSHFPEKDHSRCTDTLGCPKEHNFYGMVNKTQAQGLLERQLEWDPFIMYLWAFALWTRDLFHYKKAEAAVTQKMTNSHC